jgi:hypothetical protein
VGNPPTVDVDNAKENKTMPSSVSFGLSKNIPDYTTTLSCNSPISHPHMTTIGANISTTSD